MIYNNNKSGDKKKAREYVEYEITCTSPCIVPENEGNKKPNVKHDCFYNYTLQVSPIPGLSET